LAPQSDTNHLWARAWGLVARYNCSVITRAEDFRLYQFKGDTPGRMAISGAWQSGRAAAAEMLTSSSPGTGPSIAISRLEWKSLRRSTRTAFSSCRNTEKQPFDRWENLTDRQPRDRVAGLSRPRGGGYHRGSVDDTGRKGPQGLWLTQTARSSSPVGHGCGGAASSRGQKKFAARQSCNCRLTSRRK